MMGPQKVQPVLLGGDAITRLVRQLQFYEAYSHHAQTIMGCMRKPILAKTESIGLFVIWRMDFLKSKAFLKTGG